VDQLAIVIDDRGPALMIEVAIPIALLDHDGIVAIVVVALPDHFTIAVAIVVTMAGTDRHADRTHTDSHIFRTGRHGKANSSHGNGYYCKTLDHRVLLSL
jgi:hypothetical protein